MKSETYCLRSRKFPKLDRATKCFRAHFRFISVAIIGKVANLLSEKPCAVRLRMTAPEVALYSTTCHVEPGNEKNMKDEFLDIRSGTYHRFGYGSSSSYRRVQWRYFRESCFRSEQPSGRGPRDSSYCQ